MKKQKQQKQKTKKEDLQEYVLSNYVGKNFVWSHLVTMPSITLMKSIHNTLWNAKKHVRKDKELTQDLLNIDKLFFQILHLLYYYVTMGKDETVMVQYSVHTSVTLLTEIINQFPINDSNHAERPLHAYDKMLQLEKQLKYITTSTAALPEKTNLVLTNMLEYLENQFVVLDRVFSSVYLKYNECADFIDKHSVDKPKLKRIYDIITKFLENMKNLQARYQEHNFERLLIEERENTVADVFITPEKSSAKINASIDRSFIPDSTPKSITDDVEASAKFIKQVLDKHSMISISPILVKKPSISSRDSILMDLDDTLSSRTIGGFIIDPQQIVSPLFGESDGEEDSFNDDESIDSSNSESDEDESKFFARQPKTRRELFA